MAMKMTEAKELADTHAAEVTDTPEEWIRFLDAETSLYMYAFSNSLLIHAQKPDVTLCAELEAWNGRAGKAAVPV